MTGRTNREYQIDRFSGRKAGQTPYKYRRPFWLPASSYYVLTAAATAAVFFIFCGILQEAREEAPWVTSGILASVVLGVGVFLREIVLRKARARYLLAQRNLDANLKIIPAPVGANLNASKLTIQKNASIIQEIRQKSEAARTLGKLSDAHLEVFEMCDEYLLLNKRQMETVGIGSPRLAALRRGKEVVERLHHFHLLSWAQNETRSLTRESKVRATISEKLESAQRALETLNSALEFYPNDKQLLESEGALREFITSIKVSHWVEQAERAAFKGNFKRAINYYRDALFFMARENVQSEDRILIAEKINAEIEKLQQLSLKDTKGNLTGKSV